MLQANLFNICVFCEHVFVNASAFVWKSEDNVWESVLAVHHVSSGNRAQITSLSYKQLTCWGWLPIDSFFCEEQALREHFDLFSKSYYLSYYPNGSYIKIHIILSRVQYKKRNLGVLEGCFFKSIKEMCREITHFHSLNKWNGQET